MVFFVGISIVFREKGRFIFGYIISGEGRGVVGSGFFRYILVICLVYFYFCWLFKVWVKFRKILVGGSRCRNCFFVFKLVYRFYLFSLDFDFCFFWGIFMFCWLIFFIVYEFGVGFIIVVFFFLFRVFCGFLYFVVWVVRLFFVIYFKYYIFFG